MLMATYAGGLKEKTTMKIDLRSAREHARTHTHGNRTNGYARACVCACVLASVHSHTRAQRGVRVLMKVFVNRMFVCGSDLLIGFVVACAVVVEVVAVVAFCDLKRRTHRDPSL